MATVVAFVAAQWLKIAWHMNRILLADKYAYCLHYLPFSAGFTQLEQVLNIGQTFCQSLGSRVSTKLFIRENQKLFDICVLIETK